MFLDTQPAALDTSGGQDPWSSFRVQHPGERLGLLRQLRDGSVPINLSAPDGNHLTTCLWAVDDERQRLNFQVDVQGDRIESLVQGNELVAVAYLEAVKLQFDLHELMLVRGATSSALQAAFPTDIYRFQRRSGYRVRTLERGSPTAHLRHPSMPDMTLSLRVIDVSIGGCSLLLDGDVPPLQPGTTIAGARIELDADTRFEVSLQLQHVSAIHGSNGGVRIGCGWATLVGQAERALQRYIDQTQKRRRLLSLG